MALSNKGKLLHAMQLHGFDIENIDNDIAEVRRAMLHWNREANLAKDGGNWYLEADPERKEKSIKEWRDLATLANNFIYGASDKGKVKNAKVC